MRIVAIVVLVLATVGCGATVGPGATSTGFVEPTDTPYNGPSSGHWSGTITFHGVINVDKSGPGHSDLDPNNTYYESWVTTDTTQLDATDTFTIAAADEADLSYGISHVKLDGSAANSGTTLEHYSRATDKGNSGCTWKQDEGSETKGSWSGSGSLVGDMRFSEDGSYTIDIRADPSGDGAKVPHREWLKYSDISAACEISYPPYDNPSTQGPILEWVSSRLGDADVDLIYSDIEGQMSTGNPGSTVDGTKEWKFSDGLTMTITWHLVHDGPIVLPHA